MRVKKLTKMEERENMCGDGDSHRLVVVVGGGRLLVAPVAGGGSHWLGVVVVWCCVGGRWRKEKE
jgi:hypothetical protein